MILIMFLGGCVTGALAVWVVCAIYWSGHYSQGIIDGRAEAMESRISDNRAPALAGPARQTAAGVNLKIATQGNVIDMAAWRQWAERPDFPLPDSPTVTMGKVIEVPTIGGNEIDAWIDKVLADISERIYGP